jgi:hypothetical protein
LRSTGRYFLCWELQEPECGRMITIKGDSHYDVSSPLRPWTDQRPLVSAIEMMLRCSHLYKMNPNEKYCPQVSVSYYHPLPPAC